MADHSELRALEVDRDTQCPSPRSAAATRVFWSFWAPARAAAARKLEGRMSGRIAPRRIGIHGRQTSIRLEKPFWLWLRQIAAECGCTAKLLIECIYASKSPNQNLSSAIRIYICSYFYGSAPNHAMVDPTSRFAIRLEPPGKIHFNRDRSRRRARRSLGAL